MFKKTTLLLSLSLAISGLSSAQTEITIRTNMGDIPATLFDDLAPTTVANFLGYVERGDYDNVIFHRLVQDFVLQAGGFRVTDSSEASLVEAIQTQAPILNEYGVSNTRGTIAMAKLGGDPDSATSQWFINLNDNSQNLDNQNGGFTVFGEVNDFTVIDQIVSSTIINGGGAFSSIPVTIIDNATLTRDDLITINGITINESTLATQITPEPSIPEPSSGVLLLLTAGTALARRKR